MMSSKHRFMFFILLALQLSAILSGEIDHNINGVSMTLHTKMKRMYSEKINMEEPLNYPSDFIEYYIKLSVGTPPQDLLLMMDTGSNVVWAPCTTSYTCNNCHGYSTVFLPSKSSSALPVKCADTNCKDLCGEARCFGRTSNCSGDCPGYALQYVSGNTTGNLLTETITLSFQGGERREIENFRVGCSVVSSGFSGIAGFGRGGLSMPSQLGPLFGDKFGYCLDYVNNNSKIVVGNKAVPRDIPLTYTPLLLNPVNPSAFSHYYLGLEAVSIGGKRWTLPSNLLSFDSQGNGGTVIDSGSSYTYFPDLIYNQIAGEFASQIGYRRAPGVEELCYNVSGLENFQWPTFAFHFKGGSDMVVPSENSFSSETSGSADTFCLAMMSGGTVVNGPAVLIGNIQQNNFYILYDREKNRLGFTQRACKTLS